MTKEEILNGMSEEEFYNLYPTEEAYFMAKGGSLSGAPHNGQPTADEFFSYGAPALGHMNIPMSNPTYLAHGGTPYYGGPIRPYAEGGGDDNFIAPTNAQKVNTVPANYNTLGTQGTKTFYDKKADIAKASTSGNTQPSAQWEQSIIDRVKAGSSPEELVNAGHISAAQAGKFKQYYKPVYTETQPTTPPVTKGVPLADENKIDRKEVFGQNPYKTYQYPDVNAGYSKATMRYFDPKSNQEIDLNKSFDPKGNYIPSYLSNPAAGAQGTVKETRYNTAIGSSTDNPNTVAMNSGFAYGGYMDMGGYNSPTNYGSFSVPMAEGGYYEPGGSNDLVDWAAKQQQMLQQRTNVGIPTNVKKYFGAFDEPRKFDSTHVYPGNPNIEMGFKGNKVMLISKDSDAENTVRKVNKPRTVAGPIVKGERDVYFDYLNPHEYGGVLDASNNQDYPVMDEGGRSNLMKIIKAAGKKMKKEYAAGGDTTMQGGNQDYIANMKGTYDNFLKQNVYNSLVDQEQQDLSKAFMEKGGQPSFFQMLAENYAPRERASGFNYFPANRNRGYELSNQDYSKLSQLGNDAKLSGLGVNYGLLARGLGKFGRRMFGPKEIYFDIMHNKPTIQTKPYQQASATTTAPAETDRHVIRDPNREMNLGPAIQPKANPNISWNTNFGYGGYYQQGGNPSAMSNNWSFAGASAPQFTTPQSVGIQAPAPITMQDSGAPLVSGDTMLNKDTSRVALKRDNSAFLNAVGQYAVPGINKLAGMIEAPGQQKRQKQAMLNAMTPGSDTGPFAVKPANAMNRGDYDPNSGMFRPDNMVPVQFPGGMYNDYGRGMAFGGTYEEGEEYELSQEEIEELRNQGYEIEELD